MRLPIPLPTIHMRGDQSSGDAGLVDTNILIHWSRLSPDLLPRRIAVSTITIPSLSVWKRRVLMAPSLLPFANQGGPRGREWPIR